jgi:hypothetical protein
MSMLILLACTATPTDTSTDDTSATDDTSTTDDTADSQAVDLPPTLTADVSVVWGAVGQDLALSLVVDDEDPGGVVLTAELDDDALATGALDGVVWTGTAVAPGSTTLHVTATDAGGQSATLEVPLETWTPRTWRGFLSFQSTHVDVPSPCIGMSRDGWTYVAGWSGDVALMAGMDPQGEGWMHTFWATVEHGRCAAVDESNGHALYVGERYPAALGVLRSVNHDGVVWEADAPWGETTAYWVDARDGVAAVAGSYGNSADGTRGGWAQLYDTSDGTPQGDPIVLTRTPRSVRAEPSSVQLLDDGTVLTGSWGYWDWSEQATTALPSGWVQISEPGDELVEPLIVLQVEGATVVLHDAQQLSDGRIAVVGETDGALVDTPLNPVEGFLMVFEADGTLAWGVQNRDRSMRFVHVAEGRDGRLFVAADGGVYQDWVGVLAYDADGTPGWVATVIDGGETLARGVAIQGDDLVFTGAFKSGLEDQGIESLGDADGFIVRLNTDGDVQL